ncbi:MAG TPA: tol-pal system-associated acyl-CoA thioesterase [Stellaceae bacterium]
MPGVANPGWTHSMPLRVYYEDTDAAGIVYYANYLKFAERGRTEMMRALGFEHSGILEETGIAFIVRRLSADYRAAARLDDALTVETAVQSIGAATLQLDQQIRRDGDTLVALDVLVACVGRDGRPRRLPSGLRAALAGHGELPASGPPIVQKTP